MLKLIFLFVFLFIDGSLIFHFPQAYAEEEEVSSDIVNPILNPKEEMNSQIKWMPPQYESQKDKMGYSPGTFAIPRELEKRVNFWINVYTKYSTHEGFIHDSEYMDNIFTAIDFRDIDGRVDKTDHQKEKMRREKVKETKKKYVAILNKLDSLKSAEGLEGEELRVWKMYENVYGKRKFSEATQKKRMRFQLGQKDRFIQGIFYSGRFLKKMEEIFDSYNLPRELVRLAFVESSFNVFARSKVGASGVWQIMRSSGKHYLRINNVIDERNDPLIATHAAAKILRFNFQFLNEWPFAITAYNHGPAGVHRQIQRSGSKDIGELIEAAEGRRFGFASKNFFAAFLAAVEVEKRADFYFGDVYWDSPLDIADIHLSQPIYFKKIVEWFDGDHERALLFNPHLTKTVRNNRTLIPEGALLHIMKSKIEVVSRGFAKESLTKETVVRSESPPRGAKETVASVASVKMADSSGVMVKGIDTKTVDVKTAEVMGVEAVTKAAGDSKGAVITKMPMESKVLADPKPSDVKVLETKAAVGSKSPVDTSLADTPALTSQMEMPQLGAYQQMVTPMSSSQLVDTQELTTQMGVPQARSSQFSILPVVTLRSLDSSPISFLKEAETRESIQTHRIAKGESLFKIAKRYKVSIHKLMSANSLKMRSKLRVGQEILIPTTQQGFSD